VGVTVRQDHGNRKHGRCDIDRLERADPSAHTGEQDEEYNHLETQTDIVHSIPAPEKNIK
jgi:hypothetical protein